METKEFPTRQINTDNSNKKYTGPLPPLDEIDTTNIDPSTTIELGNEKTSETEAESIESNSTELIDNATEKSNNKKKIIAAISGIALVAVGMATYVGSVFGFKKEIPTTTPPKAQTESTQSTHEAVTETKPNIINTETAKPIESSNNTNIDTQSAEVQTNQTSDSSSKTSETSNTTQEKTKSIEYVTPTHSELMSYRDKYINYLNSVESYDAASNSDPILAEEIGDWCLEEVMDSGILDSIYDKTHVRKYVNADSPIKDIVEQIEIKEKAAHATSDLVSGSSISNHQKGIAVSETIFYKGNSQITTMKQNIRTTILSTTHPAEITGITEPLDEGKVYKVLDSNGKETRVKIAEIQNDSNISKNIYAEQEVQDFKGNTFTDMKFVDKEITNMTDEEIITTAGFSIIK